MQMNQQPKDVQKFIALALHIHQKKLKYSPLKEDVIVHKIIKHFGISSQSFTAESHVQVNC